MVENVIYAVIIHIFRDPALTRTLSGSSTPLLSGYQCGNRNGRYYAMPNNQSTENVDRSWYPSSPIANRNQAVARIKGRASASVSDNERPNNPKKYVKDDQNALYIPLQIVGVESLLDTGSSVTVCNPKLLDKLPSHLSIHHGISLCMANGDTSIPRHKADFQLEANGTTPWHSMILADLEEPLILGYGFMYDHDCSLDVRKGHLKWVKKHIQSSTEGQRNFVFSIKLDNDFTVPPWFRNDSKWQY